MPSEKIRRLIALATSYRDLAVATLILSVTTFTMGAMQTVLPLYAQSLGATVQQWGLIAAMWGVAMAFGEPFWGWFHDRLDPILPLVFRTLSGTAVFLVMMLVPAAWPLFLLNLALGFSDAASWPASRSIISRAVAPARTALAMAILWTGVRIGLSLGSLAAGQVANAFGYRSALLMSAILSLGAIFLIIPRFGWPRLRLSRLRAAWPTRTSKLEISRYRPFIVLGGITILSSLGWGSMTFLPFFVTSSLGGNVADVGMLFNVSGLAIAALLVAMGGLGDKLGRKKMVVAGLALYAAGIGSIGFARSLAQALAFMLLGSVGQAACRPSIEAMVSGASLPEERGSIMGLYGTCEDMGGILGPAVGSVMWGLGGAQATFMACGCLIGAGSLLALFAIRPQLQNATVALP